MEINKANVMNRLKYKAIITDLDGTLLHDSGVPDDKTVKLLREYQKQGGVVVIATSRHLSQCKKIASAILDKKQGYLIVSNGMYLYDGDYQQMKTFPGLCRKDYLHILSAYPDGQITVVTDGKDYIVQSRHLLLDFLKNLVTNIDPRQMQKRRFLKKQKDSVLDIPIEKIIVTFDEQQERNETTCHYNEIQIGSGWIEFQHSKTDKAMAARHLMVHLGIADKEVIVFGDDENDRKILSHYEHSVAMGNAKESIKRIAKSITDSNNNGGIFNALKRMEIINGI